MFWLPSDNPKIEIKNGANFWISQGNQNHLIKTSSLSLVKDVEKTSIFDDFSSSFGLNFEDEGAIALGLAHTV